MNKPSFILAAASFEISKLNKIFESGEGTVMELLKNPGSLRHAGWDLQTLDTPRIIKGEYIEVRNGDRKLINLYEDGTLIIRAAANNSFLGWGRNSKSFAEKPRLNPVAVIEFIYNFVDFYKKIIPYFSAQPSKIKFKVEFENTLIGSERLYLIPYGIDTYDWMFDDDQHQAPDDDMEKEVDISINDLIDSPAFVAYKLVELVYLWFGLEIKEIPYVCEDNEKNRIIDIEKIKKLSN